MLRRLIKQCSNLYLEIKFAEQVHNLILVSGTGAVKPHTAIALGVELIQRGKKVRFYNAVDLIDLLIKEQSEQR